MGQAAVRAKESGSTRFCMGAAWRGPSQVGPRQFQRVLDMVGKVRGLGMEVCTTLGMLTPEQAAALREAGLTAYNHNLDTSREHYGKVTSSRSYDVRGDGVGAGGLRGWRQAGAALLALGRKGAGEGKGRPPSILRPGPQALPGPAKETGRWEWEGGADGKRGRARPHKPAAPAHAQDRLATIETVRQAGISVCAGGIIGLGEGHLDRVGLLHQLATLPAHPESVPINSLVAVKGTPFEGYESPTGLDLVRCIATARVLMPRTVVRLSAGRMTLSFADQALCFLAGANSIFDGDKLLTTPNNDRNEDMQLFGLLGLRSRPAFVPYTAGNQSSAAFDDQVPCPRRQAQAAEQAQA